MKTLSVCVLLFASLLARAGAGEALLHDDFEKAWTPPAPPGWKMTGGQAPDDYYTRDTENPHGGQASLRIRHPADGGWRALELSAEQLPTRPANIYTISFWARAEKAGFARFDWKALQSLSQDTPFKGHHKLEVGQEWKEFVFPLREGQDFFADEGRLLLLIFSAVWNEKEDRTLWIDDLRVTEQPDPHPLGLINDRSIPHEALQHRLRPGDRLEFSVDPGQRLRPATKEAGGLSFHTLVGWTEPYHPEGDHPYQLAPLEGAIREMELPLTRFYAVGEPPFGVETGIDKVAEVLQHVGIDQERCVVEFEHQHSTRAYPPETWADGVKHALKKGYAFHHWEIANEPYSATWGLPDFGQAYPTPEAYIGQCKAVASAIRAVDPKAQIGVDIDPNQTLWGNYILKQLAGVYDFVAPHFYFWARLKQTPFEEVVLTGNYKMLDKALRTKALIHAYNPDRQAYIYDTEWGVLGHSAGEEEGFDVRTANIMGVLHVAVRLIYYAREDILHGASGWCLLGWIKKCSNGILTLNAPEKRYMLYWLYYYFNRHVGETVLATDGVAPYNQPQYAWDREKFGGPQTPVLATLSRDEKQIFLVIANGSWSKPAPCKVHLSHFPAGKVEGVVLVNSDLDGNPLLDRKEDAVRDFAVDHDDAGLSCTIPAHAVVFLKVVRSE